MENKSRGIHPQNDRPTLSRGFMSDELMALWRRLNRIDARKAIAY